VYRHPLPSSLKQGRDTSVYTEVAPRRVRFRSSSLVLRFQLRPNRPGYHP